MATATPDPDQVTIYVKPQMEDSFRILNDLRKNQQLCDVTLVSERVETRAHKNVLASCSPHFYGMFTNSKHGEDERIVLDVKPDMLLPLVNYMYTSKLIVPKQKIKDLLEVSKKFSLYGLRVECCKVLNQSMSPDNCLGIRAMAITYDNSELLISAESYIDKHFTEVVVSGEFLGLTHEELSQLIRRVELETFAKNICESIVRWINHDCKARQKYLKYLMRHVRLELIPESYIKRFIANNPLVREDTYCKDLILNALLDDNATTGTKSRQCTGDTKISSPIDLDKNETGCEGVVKPRCYAKKDTKTSGGYDENDGEVKKKGYGIVKTNCYDNPFLIDDDETGASSSLDHKPGKSTKVLLAVGGNGTQAQQNLEQYDFHNQNWSRVFQMSFNIRFAGLTVVNEKAYITGGCRNSVPVRLVKCYDITTNSWYKATGMQTERSGHGVGVIKNHIYAVGGRNKDSLNSVETFNVELLKWFPTMPMMTRRCNLGVTVLNDVLYAVGGYDGNSYLKSVECYDYRTDNWKRICSMNEYRRGASVCTSYGKIYAIGGFNGRKDLSTAEEYEPRTDSWTQITPMSTARTDSSVAVVNNHIYVVGGRNHTFGGLNSIEVYNIAIDSWTMLPKPMSIPRSGHSVVVLEKY